MYTVHMCLQVYSEVYRKAKPIKIKHSGNVAIVHESNADCTCQHMFTFGKFTT